MLLTLLCSRLSIQSRLLAMTSTLRQARKPTSKTKPRPWSSSTNPHVLRGSSLTIQVPLDLTLDQFECNSLSVRVLAPLFSTTEDCTGAKSVFKPGRIDSTGCHNGHCHSGMKTWRLTAWCMQQLSEYDHPHCLLYFCMPTPPVECKPTVRSNSGSHSILLGVEASPAFVPPNFWLVDAFSM